MLVEGTFFHELKNEPSNQVFKELSELDDVYQVHGFNEIWGPSPVSNSIYSSQNQLYVEVCENYVVATGVGRSLEDFISAAFDILDLNWWERVEIDSKSFRPTDFLSSVGDPTKAESNLSWKSSTTFEHLIQQMIEAEVKNSHD